MAAVAAWRVNPTWTRSLISFTLLSSFCFSTTMADTVLSPSCYTNTRLCHPFVTPAHRAAPQSAKTPHLHALRLSQDVLLLFQVPGDNHGHVDRILLEPILERERTAVKWRRRLPGVGGVGGTRTCRFLLIFRMLCCSRKLFSSAKRLCWSSS